MKFWNQVTPRFLQRSMYPQKFDFFQLLVGCEAKASLIVLKCDDHTCFWWYPSQISIVSSMIQQSIPTQRMIPWPCSFRLNVPVRHTYQRSDRSNKIDFSTTQLVLKVVDQTWSIPTQLEMKVCGNNSGWNDKNWSKIWKEEAKRKSVRFEQISSLRSRREFMLHIDLKCRVSRAQCTFYQSMLINGYDRLPKATSPR